MNVPTLAPMNANTEWRRTLLIFLAAFFVYAWFFQGYGFNQNAHFDTVRAIVERGTFEITPYVEHGQPGFTGDVARVGERVYSSKPPGLAVILVPFYAMVYVFQHIVRLDPTSPAMVLVNQQLCTIWGGALPGAILTAALYRHFRRRALPPGDAMLLASGFAFGSLMLPYSGMLVTQTLMAACLFAAWRCIDERPTIPRVIVAGVLLGIALLAEISAAPLVLAYVALLWFRNPRRLPLFLIGPVLAVAALLMYQHAVFGAATETSYSRVNEAYLDQTLYFGHFDLPNLRRLYWLSFHPIRGLFYCSPVLAICLLSLLCSRDRTAPRWSWIVPAAVIANFLLFNLTYHAWTGGWGVGPRYLVPAMGFMMVFAAAGYRRFPGIALALIVISIASMFAVTAVRVQWPAKLFGPPYGDDPVSSSILRLVIGDVALSNGSTNVGLLLGLRGRWSLIPPLLVITALGVEIFLLHRRERAAAFRADAADVSG
ncbi:MAG: hypothetical protein ABIP55_05510 [Tepidisphaeraceae bacterium]